MESTGEDCLCDNRENVIESSKLDNGPFSSPVLLLDCNLNLQMTSQILSLVKITKTAKLSLLVSKNNLEVRV